MSIGDALAQERAAIAETRARVATLKGQREHLQSAPLDREEVARRVDRLVRELADNAPRLGAEIASPLFPFGASQLAAAVRADPAAFLAATDPEKFSAALMSDVPANGITAAERMSRIAEADAELLSAEIGEEVLLRRLDDAIGGHERRRIDAPVNIILAPTAELEAASDAKPRRGPFGRAA